MKRILLTAFAFAFGVAFLTAQSATSIKAQANGSKDGQNGNSKSTTQQNTQIDLPGFPVYVNTGNQAQDDADYANAKQEWISNNPELYDAYTASLTGQVIVVNKKQSDLPGFPKYINTGNLEQDKIDFEQAKKLWIMHNQSIYNDFINSSK